MQARVQNLFKAIRSNKLTNIGNKNADSGALDFILLQQNKISVFEEDKSEEFDLLKLDDFKTDPISAIINLFGSLKIKEGKRIFFLVDPPYLEVQFIKLPYVVKEKNIRPIIAHALQGVFVRNMEQLTFSYELNIKDKQSYLVVYATLKDFSEKLAPIMQEKKLFLEGIFPLHHWLFKDFRVLKAGNLPENYLYLDLSQNIVKVSQVNAGIAEKYWHMRFDNKLPVANQLIDRLKILEFEGGVDKYQLFIEPRDEKSLQAAEIITPESKLPLLITDFSSLYATYLRLNAQNSTLSMLRIANALFKEAMGSYGELKKIGAMMACGVGIILIAGLVKYGSYRGNISGYNKQYSQIILRYPGLTGEINSDETKINAELNKALNIWKVRREFLARSYSFSNFFRDFYKLVGTSNVNITKLSRDDKTMLITGNFDNQAKYDKMIADLQKFYPHLKIEQNVVPLNNNKFQFSISIG